MTTPDPTALVPVVLLVSGIALLGWLVLSRPRVDKALLANLRRGLGVDQPEDAEAPGRASWVGHLAARLIPAGRRRALERLWTRAGRPAAWPVPRLVTAKLALPFVAAVLTLLYLDVRPGALTVVVGGVVVVVCHFLPELLLHSRAQERSQQITLELADTLDQMTIAVEAGLGFLATRTDVADLRRFVRSIIQADRYGVAVGEVLRTQAAEMRMKRRQRAEEKAMQIPVKVIFPLMLCILPVLFIVLLGPAAMDIMKTLG
jgi:tight adherence protein C